ncbi:MAG: FAD-dependent thymidylate synthase [Epsilonproteobacteria bacterium]|nr:FAD-dependent thymidylate synthase [Campylobacterota bacterium]
MRVTILDNFYKPTDIAVASARSCYTASKIVTPQDVSNWSKKSALLESIFKAGHHTTLQHYHFTILIEGMSRHLIWRLLHSHMFYNSEQVSQRYAKMQIDNFYIPKNANFATWNAYYTKMFRYYEEFCELLTPIMHDILPNFQKHTANKKAQEIARYLLPVGMKAHLYHTINVITALRYINVAKVLPEARTEGMEFAKALEAEMLRIDKDLKPLIDFAHTQEVTFPKINIDRFKKNPQDDVAVFDIINHDYKINENFAGVLRSNNIFIDESILGGFNSYVKLSLSADAQNQRHRRSIAIRAPLEDIYQRDFYIPPIIQKHFKEKYVQILNESYDFFESEKQHIGFGEAVYALANAHNIQIIQKDDFHEFNHKAQMRLCYNAQGEIFDIIYKQITKLKQSGVDTSNFLPPCAIRYKHNIKPYCPEGERFCGIKVWKIPFEKYQREI